MVYYPTRAWIDTYGRGNLPTVRAWLLRPNAGAPVYDFATFTVPIAYGSQYEPTIYNNYYIEALEPYPISDEELEIDNSRAIYLGPWALTENPNVKGESKKDNNLPAPNRREDTAFDRTGSGTIIWTGDPDIEPIFEERGTIINAAQRGFGGLTDYADSDYYTLLLIYENRFAGKNRQQAKYYQYRLHWKVTFDPAVLVSDGKARYYNATYHCHLGVNPDGCFFDAGMYYGVLYQMTLLNQLCDLRGNLIP